MKRLISIIMIISNFLNFYACMSTRNEKIVRIGVIDSCISKDIQNKYNITNMNDIIGIETKNNITHGSMILSIILQNVSYCEIFYCSVYNEDCIGKIDNVVAAIEYCIENNVDIITMSFATLTDNDELKKNIEKAIDNNIIITAACINLSDLTCYPAMYDDVISISEGFNKNAKLILKGKKVKFDIDGMNMERREVSFLTAYVCGKIAKQLSKGKTIEEILKANDFD